MDEARAGSAHRANGGGRALRGSGAARHGRHGYGVLACAQHPLERMAVLKLIHREMAADATAVGRFEREMA